MGLLDGLRRLLKGAGGPGFSAECPSPECPDAPSVFEAVIARMNLAGADSWATFEATCGPSRRREVVEVAYPDQVNLCTAEVDLAALLRRADQGALAMRVEPIDGTLFRVRDASERDLADAVNAVYAHHYGLGPNDTVVGKVQG